MKLSKEFLAQVQQSEDKEKIRANFIKEYEWCLDDIKRYTKFMEEDILGAEMSAYDIYALNRCYESKALLEGVYKQIFSEKIGQ